MKVEKTKKNDKTTNVVNLWLPVVIWAFVIFLFSSFPTTRASEIHWKDFIVKKTAHIVEYAILSTLIYRALKESGADRKKAGIYAIFFSVIYGFTDEFHQSFTSGREAKLRDVIFDTIGSVGSIYFLWRLLPKAPKKLKSWAKIANKLKANGLKQKAKANAQILALIGDLGSGKTTFVQGLAKGLGVEQRIISPTYIIMRNYRIKLKTKSLKLKTFYHVDLYRLEDNIEHEIANLGLKEIWSDPENIVAIEWAEKIRDLVPRNAIWIKFENKGDDRRKISVDK